MAWGAEIVDCCLLGGLRKGLFLDFLWYEWGSSLVFSWNGYQNLGW